jgi:hypothetical protein
MSSRDPNSATDTVLPLLTEPLVGSASDRTFSPPTNTKDEIDPQALLLLREFFLLLDQWDQQQQSSEGATT